MATITPTITYRPNGHANSVLVVWEGLATGDDGAPVELPSWPDKTVQVLGNFNAASVTLTMQGSLDGGTTYFSLTDPQGNAIAKTAAAAEVISESPKTIRPLASGGAAGDIDIYLLASR
jgi:hypothetical protein